VLLLTSTSVIVQHASSRAVFFNWAYNELCGWSYGPDRVNIKVGSLMEKDQTNFKATTYQGREICHIISLYVSQYSKDFAVEK
jgi:hypothetical protein